MSYFYRINNCTKKLKVNINFNPPKKMCKCPTCDSSSRRRLERNFILKLVPKAKYYKCYRCKTKFLKVPFILNSFVIKREIPRDIQIVN